MSDKIEDLKDQVHEQFSEVIDAGIGSLKTTLAGLLTMTKNDVLNDNYLWENWVVGGAILVIGLYSRSR